MWDIRQQRLSFSIARVWYRSFNLDYSPSDGGARQRGGKKTRTQSPHALCRCALCQCRQYTTRHTSLSQPPTPIFLPDLNFFFAASTLPILVLIVAPRSSASIKTSLVRQQGASIVAIVCCSSPPSLPPCLLPPPFPVLRAAQVEEMTKQPGGSQTRSQRKGGPEG